MIYSIFWQALLMMLRIVLQHGSVAFQGMHRSLERAPGSPELRVLSPKHRPVLENKCYLAPKITLNRMSVHDTVFDQQSERS